MKLKDRVAIVTGSGRGIGKEIAVLLAKEGADVVVSSRTESEINKVAEEIKAIGRCSIAIKTDITHEVQVNRLIKKTIEEFGEIDILVNNAGVNLPGSVVETKAEEWDIILDSYLKGTYLCCKAVLREMKKKKKGQIINISSIAGKRGVINAAPYSAAKFGVIGFSQALALEVKNFGIKISVICPGRVDNPNWDKISGVDRSNMLKATDVAQAVVFIASQPKRAVVTEIVIRPFPDDPV